MTSNLKPVLGTVFFRGAIPPRADNFPKLATHGIDVQPEKPRDDEHWSLRLRHPKWGEARVAVPRDLPMPTELLLKHDLGVSAEERVEALRSGNGVHVELSTTEPDPLKHRKDLLRFLHAIGDVDATIHADLQSRRFWTSAALADELSHDAELDVEALYCIHAISDDGAIPWLHTHGLAEAGRFDLDILAPHPSLVSEVVGCDVLRVLAWIVMEGAVRPDEAALQIVNPRGVVAFVPVDAFMNSAAQHDRNLRSDGTEDDHRHRRSVVCEPAGLLGRWFGKRQPSRLLQEELQGRYLYLFSDEACDRMARRAQKTVSRLGEILEELRDLELSAFAKIRYETDDGGYEHLWFTIHAITGAGIDATLDNQPFDITKMKKGDRAVHDVSRMSDWLIPTPVGPITPRSLRALRTLRAERDDIRDFLKKKRAESVDG